MLTLLVLDEMSGTENSQRRPTPLAAAIADAIERRGLTQRDLARLADVSQPRITQILAGDDTKPETLRRLCKALFVGDFDDDYRRFEAKMFEAAGFVPDGHIVVPKERYRPDIDEMLRDIAAQYGHLGEPAMRRIKRSIRAELEDEAAARGMVLELPDDF